MISHAGDGEDRLAVEGRVAETVQQMDAAGTRGGSAHAELAGELRVAARHQRGRFLVAHLDEADVVAPLAQGFHDPVDAVTREAEDDVDAPVFQCLDQDVGRCHCHRLFLLEDFSGSRHREAWQRDPQVTCRSMRATEDAEMSRQRARRDRAAARFTR